MKLSIFTVPFLCIAASTNAAYLAQKSHVG